jgi:hypothetical protein
MKQKIDTSRLSEEATLQRFNITLQKVGQKWKELLVQEVMATSTNRAEQCTKE